MEFNSLLGVKIIHLIDETDLFKISNLVLGGQASLTDLYSSLAGERGRRPVRCADIMLFFLGSWFRVSWIMGFIVQLDSTYWF
jgi:hypothetical protein